MTEHEVLKAAIILGAVMVPVLMFAAASTRYTKPVGYDDDQPRVYPQLGSYGPNNEGLPDISTGWHIFADGNAWCAVGPTFIDLVQSDSGWGYTHAEAYRDLMRVLRGTDVFDLVNRPQLADFVIHQPTVKPNV